MTRVIARYSRDGYSIAAVNHAGTTESCTAISAILWALAGWCENNVGQFSMDKGDALLCIPKTAEAAAVMDMTVIGIQQIARANPNDVTIEIVCEE